METEHANGQVASTLHAVIIPYPSQGHITPCLQLAKKLVGLGFRITFVNTIHNQERMMKSRSKKMEPDEDIDFVSVSDGLPESHPRLGEMIAFDDALLEMGPAFEELFVSLLRASPITCVIRDALFTVSQGIAKKLGIPVVCFATPSAIGMQCLYNIPTFLANGVLPIPSPPCHVPNPDVDWFGPGPPLSDEEAAHRQAPLTCLPGGSLTMRVEDIPTLILTRDLNSYFFRFYREEHNPLLPDCECILVNTFYDLEGDVLDAMSVMNSNVYAIGPLVINSRSVDGVEESSLVEAGSALWEVDPTCLLWLNDRKPNSVLFVSFGSLASISREEVQELACGLEMSGHAFLWVIRPDLIEHLSANKEFRTMFSEFVIRTKDRALLVPWVPQTAVLSHPSVAAFLTHCGWNSILESICSGVPMLGWPRFSDQSTNCHYIVHVWKIGLDLKIQAKHDGTEFVSKEEVAQKVRKIMAEDGMDLEVDKLRTNHGNLQIAARKAVGKGGLSHAGLMKFVEQMHSLQAKR